jgi:hypothetical protein
LVYFISIWNVLRYLVFAIARWYFRTTVVYIFSPILVCCVKKILATQVFYLGQVVASMATSLRNKFALKIVLKICSTAKF